MTPEDLMRMLANGQAKVEGVQIEERKSSRTSRPRAMQARVLRDLLPEVQAKNPFEVGDLVEVIPAYSTYRWPVEGDLAIVSHVLTEADRAKARGIKNAHSREDIVVLCLVHDEGEERWIEFCVESWRFRKYEGDVE